jgi:estrogen-related receptor beta like 1
MILPDTKNQLEQFGTMAQSALERVVGKEKYINNQFQTLAGEFRQAQEALKKVTEAYQSSSDNINNLTNELSAATEKLEEIKTHMDSRGNSMTDTSPLVQIKRALQSLREEIKTFELRIGVVGHSLMQSKIR